MNEFTDKPGFAFGPDAPPEVSGYLKNKGVQASWLWQDVEPEEHAVAFAVAKATNADVLGAIKGALEEAIDKGLPFEQFQRDLKPDLQKLGWWGIKRRYDPTRKEERLVKLGSPRRLKTIYDANIRSARATGAWNRIQRLKKAMPYLVYELGPSENHREHHVAKKGIVLPVDDPFWLVWYPPNGWGCKCRVRQITRRMAEKLGISKSPGDLPTRSWTNKVTGEVQEIPLGIDPGWQRNPGILRRQHMERFLANTLESADPQIAKVMVRDMVNSWRFRRVHDGTAPGFVPVAMMPERLRSILKAPTRVVEVSGETFSGKRKHFGDSVEAYLHAQEIIENGSVTEDRQGHLRIDGEADGKWWRLAMKLTKNDEVLLTSLRRTNVKQVKKAQAGGP